MASNPPKAPKIEYRYSEGFELYPASGAFGGPVPTAPGWIQCNFYFDSAQPPVAFSLVGAPERPGQFKEPDGAYNTGTIERKIQTGILLTPEQAISISDWLRKHAQTVLEMRRQLNA